MVLAVAVLIGGLAGIARARLARRPYRVIPLQWPWLALLAFLPQWLAFYFAPTRDLLPDGWAPVILVGSQAALLVFAWRNRRQPGLIWLAAGLLLNFIVIVLNGGLMPIRPEAVRQLYPLVPEDHWQVGARLGHGKDIVLPLDQTRLWLLSDYFLLPAWAGYPMAFSLGDALMAGGVLWLLWSLGGPEH